MDRIFINKEFRSSVVLSQVERPRGKSVQLSALDFKRIEDGSRPQLTVLPASLERSAFSERSMETVFDMYFPAGILKAGANPTSGFACLLPRLSQREAALKNAVLAIGLVAFGEEQQNKAIVQQGRMFYGQALRELGVAIRDSDRRRSEALLVVPQLLGLYEVSSSDFQCSKILLTSRIDPFRLQSRSRQTSRKLDEPCSGRARSIAGTRA